MYRQQRARTGESRQEYQVVNGCIQSRESFLPGKVSMKAPRGRVDAPLQESREASIGSSLASLNDRSMSR